MLWKKLKRLIIKTNGEKKMNNYTAAKKADTEGLEWLWKECFEFIRLQYRSISSFARAFIDAGNDYNVRTVVRVFAENSDKRIVSEKILLDIMDFLNIEIKKKVSYEAGADTLETIPEAFDEKVL